MSGETLATNNSQPTSAEQSDRNQAILQPLQLGCAPRTEWVYPTPPESVSPGEALPQSIVLPTVHKASSLKTIRNLFCLAVLAMGSYLGVSHYLVQSVRVVGVSMVPTLRDSQNYLLNRWI